MYQSKKRLFIVHSILGMTLSIFSIQMARAQAQLKAPSQSQSQSLKGTLAPSEAISSSTNVAGVVPELPWVLSLKTEVSQNLEVAQRVGGSATDTQLRVAYKFSEDVQLGLLSGLKYTFVPSSENQSLQKAVFTDVALAGIFMAPTFMGSDKTIVDGRFYLPTSNNAQALKQSYLLRADLILPYTLNALQTGTLYISPRWTEFSKGPSKLEMVSQAKMGWGKTWSPYVALNHKLKVSKARAGLTRDGELMGPEVGIEVLPHKLAKFYFYVAQEHNILNPKAQPVSQNYSVFNETETKYLFGAQIKL